MKPVQRAELGATTAFVRRHRWGLLTLATALFLWGVGAVGTPAPALLGAALAAVAVSLVTALARLGVRRYHAFTPAESLRTRTSMALHSTSLLLCGLFLGGLFVAPRSTTTVARASELGGTPERVSATVSWQPAAAWEEFMDGLAAAKRDSAGLRILSFNVWHGYPSAGAREERYQRIRDLLLELEPDVVLLQESWRTRRFGGLAERLSEDLGLGFAYTRANGSLRYLGFEEGLAILSRHPISEARRMALAPRMPPWEMRAALGATIAIPGLGPLEVWNTHLSHSDAFARDGQAQALASALDGSRVAIVAGDFNGGAKSPAVEAFASLDLEPVLSDGIDHVLLSPALRQAFTTELAEPLRFGDVEIPGTLLTRPEVSDHPALLVELRRRGP